MEFLACLCSEHSYMAGMAGMAAFFKTSTKESRKEPGLLIGVWR
jgi:hypothetical protein